MSQISVGLLALGLAACSSKAAPPPGDAPGIVVCLTVDWEGASLDDASFAAVDKIRAVVPDAPFTHFVTAAYFTKPEPDPEAPKLVAAHIRPGDELAVHLHGWRSIAQAADVVPKLSPSFFTGTDELITLEDGDAGYDLDVDAYSRAELRAILRTSRKLLEQVGVPVARTFRAGGYLGTPKVLGALRDEGFVIDSSEFDAHGFHRPPGDFFTQRVLGIWPDATRTRQPHVIEVDGGTLLEMPMAAVADESSSDDIVKLVEAAHTQRAKDPSRDVFVVIELDLETALDFAERVQAAMATIEGRPALAREVQFATIDRAAARAQRQLGGAAGR